MKQKENPSKNSSEPLWYHWSEKSLTLRLKIQPRTSRCEVSGLYGDRMKIKLTSPPVDGAANEELIAFLSKSFGVAKSKVQLLRGETSRDKDCLIEEPQQLPDWGLFRP